MTILHLENQRTTNKGGHDKCDKRLAVYTQETKNPKTYQRPQQELGGTTLYPLGGCRETETAKPYSGKLTYTNSTVSTTKIGVKVWQGAPVRT